MSESLGPQRVDVPDTVGSAERAAALRLRRVGLEVGAVSQLPWENAAEDTVLAQDPPAHAQGIERPSVNLLVAAPDDVAPDGFVMPDLVGVPIVTAQAELAKVGIETAPPVFADVPAPQAGGAAQPAAVPGSVIAQEPEAGARVDQSIQVKLTVAK